MKIYDFSNCAPSGRRYGGNAGAKTGIIFQDEYWFLKFPKNIRNMDRVQISYMTSPLSEYIGSHVYESIGIPVHETLLGEYKGKIVVACRDFCQNPGERLDEYESIKNDYVEGLEEKISSLSSRSEGKTDINEVKLVMDSNELFKQLPELKERFWDMFVVDAFIGNNDRNNGNWGVVVDESNGVARPAPVYDNGNSFSNKLSEAQMERFMSDNTLFKESVYTNRICAFEQDGKKINPLKFIESRKDDDCNAALLRIFPKINMKEIENMIDDIPLTYKGQTIMGKEQKAFYKKCMGFRYENVLKPAFDNTLFFGRSKNIRKQKEHSIDDGIDL